MINKIKTHKMITKVDGDDFDPKMIVYIEGHCKKCKEKAGNNTLLFYGGKHNKVDNDESMVKTMCMICKTKTILYMRNIDLITKETE